MISKLFSLSLLVISAATNTKTADTCVSKDSQMVGAAALINDAQFNDYEYLHINE